MAHFIITSECNKPQSHMRPVARLFWRLYSFASFQKSHLHNVHENWLKNHPDTFNQYDIKKLWLVICVCVCVWGF